MIICRENIYHTEKPQKKTYNKGVRPKNYIFNDKIWLNIKYIKIKQN